MRSLLVLAWLLLQFDPVKAPEDLSPENQVRTAVEQAAKDYAANIKSAEDKLATAKASLEKTQALKVHPATKLLPAEKAKLVKDAGDDVRKAEDSLARAKRLSLEDFIRLKITWPKVGKVGVLEAHTVKVLQIIGPQEMLASGKFLSRTEQTVQPKTGLVIEKPVYAEQIFFLEGFPTEGRVTGSGLIPAELGFLHVKGTKSYKTGSGENSTVWVLVPVTPANKD